MGSGVWDMLFKHREVPEGLYFKKTTLVVVWKTDA